MTLNEIQARMAQIEIEANHENADLDALEAEMRTLTEERRQILERAEARRRILDGIAGGAGDPVAIIDERTLDEDPLSRPEYRIAWLKQLRGISLSAAEQRLMDSGATSAGPAIPTQTANMIAEQLQQVAPLLNEVELLQIPGNVTVPVEKQIADAALHTEGALLNGDKDSLQPVNLSGYEIIKLVPVSAKVDAMSMAAFESWIVSSITRRMGYALENYLVNGTGVNQPGGIAAANTWGAGNSVAFAAAKPTLAELQTLMGNLNGAYHANAKWLCSAKFMFGTLLALHDNTKYPLVTFDASAGKYRLYGKEVLISSKVADTALYFGDMKYLIANFAQPITIGADASSGFRYNTIDYRGVCVFDSKPALGEAFVKGSYTAGA